MPCIRRKSIPIPNSLEPQLILRKFDRAKLLAVAHKVRAIYAAAHGEVDTTRVFDAVFTGEIKIILQTSLNLTASRSAGLRIRLRARQARVGQRLAHFARRAFGNFFAARDEIGQMRREPGGQLVGEPKAANG